MDIGQLLLRCLNSDIHVVACPPGTRSGCGVFRQHILCWRKTGRHPCRPPLRGFPSPARRFRGAPDRAAGHRGPHFSNEPEPEQQPGHRGVGGHCPRWHAVGAGALDQRATLRFSLLSVPGFSASKSIARERAPTVSCAAWPCGWKRCARSGCDAPLFPIPHSPLPIPGSQLPALRSSCPGPSAGRRSAGGRAAARSSPPSARSRSGRRPACRARGAAAG